jgi:hypothetical protein
MPAAAALAQLTGCPRRRGGRRREFVFKPFVLASR